MGKAKAQEGSSFEKDLERLEEIIAGLEEGGMPLEESLRQFEEGVALVRQCEKTLKAAERKIDMLVRGEGGDMEAVPFDEEESEQAGGPENPPASQKPPKRRQAPDMAPSEETGDNDEGGGLLF